MKDILFNFLSKYISLTEEEKNALLSLDLFHTVEKGTILLKEGQKTQNSFFVLQGLIRVFYILDGEEKTTAFYSELEVLTPPCVLKKGPSEYFISCVEDSILLISNPEMQAYINGTFPKFEMLCKKMSEKLLVKHQIDFNKFKISSPEQRYLNLLEKRPDLINRVPKHQLAGYLGIKPESLSRLRARILEKNR